MEFKEYFEIVKNEARKRYERSVSLNTIYDSYKEGDSIEEAIHTVLFESAMWDSTTGNPMD